MYDKGKHRHRSGELFYAVTGVLDRSIVRLFDCSIVRLFDCSIVRLFDCSIVRLRLCKPGKTSQRNKPESSASKQRRVLFVDVFGPNFSLIIHTAIIFYKR